MGGGSGSRGMKAASAASAKARRRRAEAGRAHARAWHVAMKPLFDRQFGFAPCDCPAHAPLGFARDRGGYDGHR